MRFWGGGEGLYRIMEQEMPWTALFVELGSRLSMAADLGGACCDITARKSHQRGRLLVFEQAEES